MPAFPLPTVLAVAAAVLAAWAVEWLGRRRGEGTPGFAPAAPAATARWAVATALLAAVLFLGVFFPFTPAAGAAQADLDLSAVAPWELFTLHALLAATLLAWGALGHLGGLPVEQRWRGAGGGAKADGGRPDGEPGNSPAGGAGTPGEGPGAEVHGVGGVSGDPVSAEAPATAAPRPGPALRLLRAFRLAEARPVHEIGVGLVAGVAIWGVVIFTVGGLAVLLQLLGRDDWLPSGPPALVSFIAAQPAWLRLAGSLSAGFFEETFFRGFLQPRVGVALSSLLFVLAHWSYGEPFMLVGVTLLSLTYAALARWRGSVWAAVTAHAVFDGVQLLVLVPLALEAVESGTVARLGLALLAAVGAG